MEDLELQRKLRDPGAAIDNAHVNAEALMIHLASMTERKGEAAEQYAGKAKRLKVGERLVWMPGWGGRRGGVYLGGKGEAVEHCAGKAKLAKADLR